MSEQLFEVAFSGRISDGANPAEVKAKIGKMFNADETKLAALFSGKRVVIKKNLDKATAAKYKTAFTRAGAECDVRPMGGAAPAEAKAPAAKPAASPAAPAAAAQSGGEAAGGGGSGAFLPLPRSAPTGAISIPVRSNWGSSGSS